MSNVMLRGDWKKRLGPTRKWKALVALHFAKLKPIQPLAKAKLTLIRHSSRRPDMDGLVSGFKPVIDGLVECGVLINDTFEVIGQPTYAFEKAPQRGGFITVEVEAE